METNNDSYSLFPMASQDIWKRLHNINTGQYAATRNFTNGAVTRLSPYISRGVISLKQVMDFLLQQTGPQQSEKLLQELAWREYFQRVWQHKGSEIWNDIRQPQQDMVHTEMVAAVANANTGIRVIDDHIHEFYSTGYMHNHVRMYLASLSCNIAKAHWRQPARWMYYHLLDADVASNTCSWQWVAGTFASKKYYCNQENINRYTHTTQHNTFLDKPYEEIIKMEVPQSLRQTITLDLITKLPETPLPAIDTNIPTLIYNSYNLDPLWHAQENYNRVLLLEPGHFENYPVSEKLISFVAGLAKNIQGIQLYCGSIEDIAGLYGNKELTSGMIISKEHPAFTYYPGIKESRSWMFPGVTGYYPSFSAYWKKVKKHYS